VGPNRPTRRRSWVWNAARSQLGNWGSRTRARRFRRARTGPAVVEPCRRSSRSYFTSGLAKVVNLPGAVGSNGSPGAAARVRSRASIPIRLMGMQSWGATTGVRRAGHVVADAPEPRARPPSRAGIARGVGLTGRVCSGEDRAADRRGSRCSAFAPRERGRLARSPRSTDYQGAGACLSRRRSRACSADPTRRGPDLLSRRSAFGELEGRSMAPTPVGLIPGRANDARCPIPRLRGRSAPDPCSSPGRSVERTGRSL